MDVALVLTHECNLGCPYCYAGRKFSKRMNRDVAELAIGYATVDRPEKVQISFFGGEPLLAWDLLEDYTKLANSQLSVLGLKPKFVVTTNGTCFTKERLEFLRENDFFLGLSIDGIPEAHDKSRPFTNGKGSFEAVYRGLKQMLRSGIDFETISVVDPSNVRHIGETVRFLVDAGVRRVSLNPNFDGIWSDDDLAAWEAGYKEVGEVYLSSYRRGHLVRINVIDDKVLTHLKGGYKAHDHCEFGRSAIAVSPAGNIYPCERLVGADEDDTHVIGTVHEGFRERRQELICSTGNHNEECDDCALKGRCMSWCACANMADTGVMNMPGGLVCFHEQTAVSVADDVASRLYKEANPMFLQNYYLR